MNIQAVTTKIVSTLGNKESLIPIMIKDGVDSASLTYKSFKEGGSIEGFDRAIDEFGTQLIWIGGIPFYKKLINNTIYKFKNISPKVDPRIIANKEYSKWALDNAKGYINKSKTQGVKDAISNCLKDGGKTAKNLYATKVIAATALTLGTFFALTKAKQKNTKNQVLKEMQEQTKAQSINIYDTNNEIFNDIKSNNPSFKGIGKKAIEAVMFNPVHNMKIIDAGITGERLACSRNKTEFCEHAIKEGGFLFFIYGFGNLIEKGINKFSSAVLKKPIDLPIDVLMDSSLNNALNNNTIMKDISKLPKAAQSLTDKLNFIMQNPDNIAVQAAKKAKIVSLTKDVYGNSVIDTSKYIDMKAFDTLSKNLTELDKKFKMSNESVKTFLNKAKGLKVASVMANIGVSCLFLGYIIPKAIYKYRQMKTGTTKFHVEEDIKNNKK